jgi:hypothetical protein
VRWRRWRCRHLHVRLSPLPSRSGLPSLQLRVQLRCDDDHDRSVGDGDIDDGNRGRAELGFRNGRGLRVPGVPGWNDVSPL